ncbi:hypothetical protein HDU76_012503 [Blyttiomyces sp. JEL0837]|nr:hypothetical protein HDU76_012503 [Blyttiomyces sp. JEL0837]
MADAPSSPHKWANIAASFKAKSTASRAALAAEPQTYESNVSLSKVKNGNGTTITPSRKSDAWYRDQSPGSHVKKMSLFNINLRKKKDVASLARSRMSCFDAFYGEREYHDLISSFIETMEESDVMNHHLWSLKASISGLRDFSDRIINILQHQPEDIFNQTCWKDEMKLLENLDQVIRSTISRSVQYRYFFKIIMSAQPSEIERLTALLVQKLMQLCLAKGLPLVQARHLDHYERIVEIESSLHLTHCQSLNESQKFRPGSIVINLTRPVPNESGVDLPPLYPQSEEVREVKYIGAKQITPNCLDRELEILMFSHFMLVCHSEKKVKVDKKGVKGESLKGDKEDKEKVLHLLFPPIEYVNATIVRSHLKSDMPNLLELRFSQILMLVQASSIIAANRLTNTALLRAKQSQESKGKHAHIFAVPSNQEIVDPPQVKAIATMTVDEIIAFKSGSSETTTHMQALCRPFLRQKTGEWDKLAKSTIVIRSGPRFSQPSVLVIMQETERVIISNQISFAFEPVAKGERDFLIVAMNPNSKAVGSYLIRVEDNATLRCFFTAIEDVKKRRVGSMSEALQDHLLINELPTIFGSINYENQLTLNVDICEFSRLVDEDQDNGSFNRKNVVGVLGPATLTISDVKLPGGSIISVMTMASSLNATIVWLKSTLFASFVFQRKLSNTVLELRFTKENVVYKLTPGKDTDFGEIANRLAETFLIEESELARQAEVQVNVEAERQHAKIVQKAQEDLARKELTASQSLGALSKVAQESRGVMQGWVANQVNFFNDLARRSSVTSRPVSKKEKVASGRPKWSKVNDIQAEVNKRPPTPPLMSLEERKRRLVEEKMKQMSSSLVPTKTMIFFNELAAGTPELNAVVDRCPDKDWLRAIAQEFSPEIEFESIEDYIGKRYYIRNGDPRPLLLPPQKAPGDIFRIWWQMPYGAQRCLCRDKEFKAENVLVTYIWHQLENQYLQQQTA